MEWIAYLDLLEEKEQRPTRWDYYWARISKWVYEASMVLQRFQPREYKEDDFLIQMVVKKPRTPEQEKAKRKAEELNAKIQLVMMGANSREVFPEGWDKEDA